MKDRLKILVADDNKHFLKAFQYILFDGFGEKIETLLTAVSGAEALKILGSNTVDVVFIDIEMPGQNGVEITKKIVSRYGNVSVVALSFHQEQTYVRQMIEAGADSFIVKEDIDIIQLQSIFDRYLN